jgi:hypothetical protein
MRIRSRTTLALVRLNCRIDEWMTTRSRALLLRCGRSTARVEGRIDDPGARVPELGDSDQGIHLADSAPEDT